MQRYHANQNPLPRPVKSRPRPVNLSTNQKSLRLGSEILPRCPFRNAGEKTRPFQVKITLRDKNKPSDGLPDGHFNFTGQITGIFSLAAMKQISGGSFEQTRKNFGEIRNSPKVLLLKSVIFYDHTPTPSIPSNQTKSIISKLFFSSYSPPS